MSFIFDPERYTEIFLEVNGTEPQSDEELYKFAEEYYDKYSDLSEE